MTKRLLLGLAGLALLLLVVTTSRAQQAGGAFLPWFNYAITGYWSFDKSLNIETEAINVRAFPYLGVGDGAADDTAALQAALDLSDSSVVGTPRAVYLPTGTYKITSTLRLHPGTRLYGDARWSSVIKAGSGFTGIMVQDSGNAAKIIIEDLQINANNEAGVTSLLELGTTTTVWGTSGSAKGLVLRCGNSTTNTGTTGLRHASNVISILDVHTMSCDNGIVETSGSSVTWYDDISVLGCATEGIHVNGQSAMGRVEIEAPGEDCIGVYVNRELSIGTLTYSQKPGVTNPWAVEIGSGATAFSMEQFVHFTSGGSVLTNVLRDNRSTYPTNWGESAASGARRETGISDRLHVATQHVFVQGQALQNFVLRITNTGGTLQHRFSGSAEETVFGDYIGKIGSAQVALRNTPTGADASTAMAFGGKISASTTNIFICDTAAQDATSKDVIAFASIVTNTTGTALIARAAVTSRNVNGVTRRRLELFVYDATTGDAFALNTTNIGSGTVLDIQFLGFLL